MTYFNILNTVLFSGKTMFSGDVRSCLRKLDTLLRVIKYPGHVDYSGLSKGELSAFLPILTFILTTVSPSFAEQLVESGLELNGKTDMRFIDTLYKILRDIFHYKPILSKQQFLQRGFPQGKMSTICDIIDLVLQRHNELKKPRVRYPVSHKGTRREDHPSVAKLDIVCASPLVVNHMQNDDSPPCHIVTKPSHDDIHSHPPENVTTQPAEKEQKEDVTFLSSNMEQRLSALEVQIESLHCGLQRLCALEDRLEKLESRSNTEKKEEEFITISKESWENLNDRVLLLETKMELDHARDDLKDRLHRITNMLKSTSEYL
uniref:centrosomal protein of 44 kDa isoform X2 n=1 Tax=Doryrhamphus excisus TaxID=161450 RepID=UPI0025AEBE59|nr:centrosomal protein of 44 kDa isoform X2 [Doryrhamphus excisus]